MMKIICVTLLAILGYAAPAQANPVVADISNYQIDIDARFIGTKLFLFGTRNEGGDVVVVIRGPKRDFTVRRKERTAGMWINRRYVEFTGVPEFYALASSRPLETITHPRLMRTLGIGTNHLFTVQKKSSRKLKSSEFSDAFLSGKQKNHLYNIPSELEFMGDTLFKTTFEFPDTIPKGSYTAEVYLMKSDQLLGMQSLPITVRKIGLDGTLSSLAHDHSAFYGIIAIMLALGAGWSANRIFQKI